MSIRGVDAYRGFSVILAGVVAAAIVYVAARAERAVAQGASETTRVEIVSDSGILLGPGDARFGVVIEPQGGAIITNWQNFRAYYVNDRGAARDLGIRLKHQHTGIAVPPRGMVIFEDLQGDYYAITAEGELREVPGIR